MKHCGAVCALCRVSRYIVLPVHLPATSMVRSGPIPRPSRRYDNALRLLPVGLEEEHRSCQMALLVVSKEGGLEENGRESVILCPREQNAG